MDELIRILKAEGLTCVALQEQRLYKKHANDILPVLHLLDQGHLQGAQLADEVVGGAVVLLMVYKDVYQIYACVISSHALEIFQLYNILATCDEQVPYITNHTKTDMRPIEAYVIDMSNPATAQRLLNTKVKSMKAKQHT